MAVLTAPSGLVDRAADWLTPAVPLGRLAAFHTLVYLWVLVDVLLYTPWVVQKATVPTELYQPLFLARVLPIPEPTSLVVQATYWALLASTLVALSGRLPRLSGAAVALLYAQWMFIAMGFSKVDHDRFGFMVALAVLPTIGLARHGDETLSRAAGWALRMAQLGAIATYVLAALAKLRYSGPAWMFGSTLTWAIVRRGTSWTRWVLDFPWMIKGLQIWTIVFELFSPVVFVVRERWRLWIVGYFYVFHILTFLVLTISFAPHLVALAAFLPLERIRPVVALRRVYASLRG